jgi:hypothetical protein
MSTMTGAGPFEDGKGRTWSIVFAIILIAAFGVAIYMGASESAKEKAAQQEFLKKH